MISGSVTPREGFRRWLKTKIPKRFSAALSRAHADPAAKASGEVWKDGPASAACADGRADGARYAGFAPTRH